MTLEEKTKEVWWVTRMVRKTNGDKTSMMALQTLKDNHFLPPRLMARVVEVEMKYGPKPPSPDKSAPRPA